MWCSPVNHNPLTVINGIWTDGTNSFNKTDGIFDFLDLDDLDDLDLEARNFYEGRADDYDKYLYLTFKTYNEDEEKVRNYMIDKLALEPSSTVLEIGCGTGRDSLLIAQRLGKNATCYFLDISIDMLQKAVNKLRSFNIKKYFALSSAIKIPLEDNSVDCIYSFGGLGEFSDIRQFFVECVRVVKPGGKVVVGDENLPVWLEKSRFGQIITNYNKQFTAKVPFDQLPVEARNVKCEWIIGGVFYLIEFEVGEGEPYANFDFDIPGTRGGTHMSRMFGQLEGVKLQTKKMAIEAQIKSGKSMHDWLDEVVLKAINESVK